MKRVMRKLALLTALLSLLIGCEKGPIVSEPIPEPDDEIPLCEVENSTSILVVNNTGLTIDAYVEPHMGESSEIVAITDGEQYLFENITLPDDDLITTAAKVSTSSQWFMDNNKLTQCDTAVMSWCCDPYGYEQNLIFHYYPENDSIPECQFDDPLSVIVGEWADITNGDTTLLMVVDTAITIPDEGNNVVARMIFPEEDGSGTIGRPNDVAEHFYRFYSDGRIYPEIYSTAILNPDTDYFPTEPLLVETVKQISMHHSHIINSVYEIGGEIRMDVAYIYKYQNWGYTSEGNGVYENSGNRELIKIN